MSNRKTTDISWNFDFASLPRWENRNSMPYVTDELFECEASDTACVIYSIAEASMCNYVGFLAILKNKRKPYLFLNVANFCFPKQKVVFNTAGNLILLQTSLYNQSKNELARPIIIIDCKESRFSYFKTNTVNPCYKAVELDENTFGFDVGEREKKNDKTLLSLSRKIIKLGKMKWYDLRLISDFASFYFA